MVSRTPQRPHAAEPFVTLSLSKTTTSKLPGSRSDNVVSTKSNTSGSINRKKKTLVKRTIRSSTDSVAANSPLQRWEYGMPPSPPSPYARSSRSATPGKRSPSPTKDKSLRNDASNQARLADHQTKITAKTVGKADPLNNESQAERRSSTASLTDTGTRSSNRTRKLTTKAQALAGTNFLPSLQSGPDGESIQNTTDDDAAQEHVTNDTGYPIQVSTPPLTLDTTMTEPPVESVETPTVRTSARERKPTARAIELESERASRKRPASPLSAERVAKISKTSPTTSVRSSKLRNSTIEAEDEPVKEIEESAKETRNKQFVEVIGDDNEEVTAKSEAQDVSISQAVTPSQSPSAPEPARTSNEPIHEQVQQQEKLPACDLACLSPSSRLFTFAKIASEWPDSDDDSGDEIDVNFELNKALSDDTHVLFEKARRTYCRCSRNPSNMHSPTFTCKPFVGGTTRKDEHIATNTSEGRSYATNGLGSTATVDTKTIPPHNPSRRHLKVSPRSTQRRKAKQQRPSMLRQSSSFEQRMQADYLASNRQETSSLGDSSALALPAGSTSLTKIIPPPVDTLTSTSLNNGDLRSGSTIGANLANSSNDEPNQEEGNKPRSIDIRKYYEALSWEFTGKGLQPERPSFDSQKAQEVSRQSQLSVKPPGTKIDQKRTKGAVDTTKRNVGKSSAAGSVRESLSNKSEVETGHVTKQYQAFAPPQAKSIRLRFTTTNK